MVNRGNIGFAEGTKYITSFGHVAYTHEFIGSAAMVCLSTGRCFICGTDQLILTDDGWVKAEDLKGYAIKGVEFTDVSLCGARVLFDLSVNTLDHCYEVDVGGTILLAHNLSIGGGIIGQSNVPAGDMYKYIPYKATKNIFRTTKIRKKVKTPNVDLARLVELGGTFEKIGGEDESVGGGNQKMGQNIQ